MKINKRRIITASLLSPLAILLIPIAGSILLLYSPTVGPMDDAPRRAAAAILMVIVPVAYPFLVVTAFLTAWALQKLHLLSKRSMATLVVTTAIISGIFFGLQSPFGIEDQFKGIAAFSFLFLLCLGLGATAWWVIAKPRSDNL